MCLPPKGFGLPVGSTMAVTGWGYLEENGEKPPHAASDLTPASGSKTRHLCPPGKVSPSLQKASVPLVDHAKCSSPTMYSNFITPRMICAGFLQGGVDACQVPNHL